MTRDKKVYLCFVAMLAVLFASPSLYAEDASEVVTATQMTEREPITLKMMVVNPSDKHTQTFPLKAYLPLEVKPEHVLSKDGMQLAYDEEKGAYYVEEEIEIAPGDSQIKSVKLQDIWSFSDTELTTFSLEAKRLLANLKDSKHEGQGRLLLHQVQTLILQIREVQKIRDRTPEEHISVYRKYKKKWDNLQIDMIALKRYVTGGDWSSMTEEQRMEAFMKEISTEQESSAIPAWMILRVIFGVLVLVGILSFVFFFIWARSVATPREPKVDMDRIMPYAKDGERLQDDEEGAEKLREFLRSEPTEPEEPKKSA